MRIACIDIGSNTTRLLVAERDGDGLREVAGQRVFTRLRGGGDSIAPEKVAEVAATVAAQVRLARAAGASEIRAVATAAIRRAANRDELCAAVREAGGVPVVVLSAEDEARLTFLGATRMLPGAAAGEVAVVDVGGGSSELVCGTAGGEVRWSRSLPVGSASLTDQLVRGDPPTAAELDRVRSCVSGLLEGRLSPPPGAAYAVGGSATSLRRLIGPVLDHETLARATLAVCAEPAAEIAARHDLHPERVRVLAAGMLLLDAAVAFLGVPLEIVCGGLREGVIIERLGAMCVAPEKDRHL
jgi:exopolyphosphatase / guanosine-5'-triphosphate,3'-diphosphate pyrophosphatase